MEIARVPPPPKGEKAVVRRLQGVAYLVAEGPFLSLLPSIETFDGQNVLVPKNIRDADRFPFSEFSSGGYFDAKKLTAKLQAAWDKSAGLTYPPEDLITIPYDRYMQLG